MPQTASDCGGPADPRTQLERAAAGRGSLFYTMDEAEEWLNQPDVAWSNRVRSAWPRPFRPGAAAAIVRVIVHQHRSSKMRS